MDLEEVPEAVKEFAEKLPRFDDGRIDYHGSKKAPVVTVFVKLGKRILLMKRSDKVYTYRGRWNTVAGYLDELKPLREKILEELEEETGVGEGQILSIRVREVYRFTDKGRTWMVHPALVEVKPGTEIKLDWEHTEYRWINPEDLKGYDTVPHLEEGLKIVLAD
ncbi:MAG: NUDIX domain-containing protein [archaeon]|nr:MAG: NUDIX domain-containing protein [archaeon]